MATALPLALLSRTRLALSSTNNDDTSLLVSSRAYIGMCVHKRGRQLVCTPQNQEPHGELWARRIECHERVAQKQHEARHQHQGKGLHERVEAGIAYRSREILWSTVI
jgi:hypothetical protein